MARASPYRTIYVPDPDDYKRIRERAEARKLSVSEYLRKAGLGELEIVEGVTPERARGLADEARYWRERFEQMAALAQDMQAEVLQLRQELRMRAAAGGVGREGPGLDALSAGLAPRILKVLTSLRSADGKYRVYTEAELREELDLQRDPLQADALRTALADLYRLNLVEPQRNGWRARE